MNKKTYQLISNFLDKVGSYIFMEYDPIYYKEFTRDKNQQRMYDFVGSYYLGGNNVPDTAYYVISFIKTHYLDKQS